MNLYDLYFDIILKEVGNLRTEELMSIHYSLIEAVKANQYLELHDSSNEFCGLVTWEIKPNEIRYGKIDVGITNLVIINKARSTYNLMRVINYLRTKYPMVASFVWKNRETGELKTFTQRGKHVEDMAQAI